MEVIMIYLCLAFTCVWLLNFIYLLSLDRKTRNIAKRLHAHSTDVTKP